MDAMGFHTCKISDWKTYLVSCLVLAAAFLLGGCPPVSESLDVWGICFNTGFCEQSMSVFVQHLEMLSLFTLVMSQQAFAYLPSNFQAFNLKVPSG